MMASPSVSSRRLGSQAPSRNCTDVSADYDDSDPTLSAVQPPASSVSTASGSYSTHSVPSLHGRSALGDLDLCNSININGGFRFLQRPPGPDHGGSVGFLSRNITPDSLADDLENFHLRSPNKLASIRSSATATGSEQLHDYHKYLETSSDEPETISSQFSVRQRPETLSATSAHVQRAIAQHEARQFEWVLSVPRDATDFLEGIIRRKLTRSYSVTDVADSDSNERHIHFGCNLLRQRTRSGSDLSGHPRLINTYKLIATPLGNIAHGDDPSGQTAPEAQTQEAAAMADSLLMPERTAPLEHYATVESHGVSPRVPGKGLEPGSATRSRSLSRSPGSAVSRIEDTIEELDRLEDEFEAVHSMVRVLPADERHNGSAKKAGTGRPSGVRMTPVLSRMSSTRKAVAAPSPQQAKKAAGQEAAGTGVAHKRLSMARPTSLLPPKPPAKSSKPPTVAAFELPGEAVARRLKEQRAKRMSAALTGAGTPTSTPVRRAHAAKVPTVPAFELPGEAISRRKREEHAARLKQQEEEEKKRREFKARPIRLSITPSTQPRETATSRARQNRMSMCGESGSIGPRPRARDAKRQSVASTLSGSQSTAGRGRGSSVEPLSTASRTSRAASTSTGSINGISGKRSAVSADEVQQQKQRGKTVYHGDSLLSVDRMQEKREREATTKQARQEAAERSRLLSRQWAERQKLRTKRSVVGVAVEMA